MKPMVSNQLLLGMLQAVKQISGANYPRLLEQAGLSRYLTALPPPNNDPACTAEEYSRLPAVVYVMLGEALARLFLRNAGTNLAEQAGSLPDIQAQATVLQHLPPDVALRSFVTGMAHATSRTWAPAIASEDATAWYIAVAPCPVCLGIRGTSAPLCASTEALFLGLARKMLDRRTRVVEIECIAAGGTCCKFAFYK